MPSTLVPVRFRRDTPNSESHPTSAHIAILPPPEHCERHSLPWADNPRATVASQLLQAVAASLLQKRPEQITQFGDPRRHVENSELIDRDTSGHFVPGHGRGDCR